ncbi:GNAT family N-acetyltransferase [Candidatus Micrarchaeota archaeon]|nr:GNAT family N-acetyltransferase [Candidatus Micrarchaeota archaeon]
MITYKEIELRGIELKDVETLNRNIGEVEINPLLSNAYYPLSSMGGEEFLKKKLREVQEKEGYLFSIYIEGDGPLGLLELSKIDWKSRHAELSLWINKGFRERGYEKKAAIAALHFAFRELGMHKVVARCIENDSMLCTLYEKELSFANEGRLREHYFHEGRYFALLFFGILEKEYAALFGTTEVAINSCGVQSKPETSGLQEEHAF